MLKEAQSLVGNIKNESLTAQLLTTQGDVKRFSGDTKAADTFYQQALKSAMRGSSPEDILICKLHAAEIALVKEIPNLRSANSEN